MPPGVPQVAGGTTARSAGNAASQAKATQPVVVFRHPALLASPPPRCRAASVDAQAVSGHRPGGHPRCHPPDIAEPAGQCQHPAKAAPPAAPDCPQPGELRAEDSPPASGCGWRRRGPVPGVRHPAPIRLPIAQPRSARGLRRIRKRTSFPPPAAGQCQRPHPLPLTESCASPGAADRRGLLSLGHSSRWRNECPLPWR